MRKNIFLIVGLAILAVIVFGFMNNTEKTPMKTQDTNIPVNNPEVAPISHASFVLAWDDAIIYTDPVGVNLFVGQPEPDIILITDIHGDHLDTETVKTLARETTVIIAPQAVADQLPADFAASVTVLNNGEKKNVNGFDIEAIPAYNLPNAENADRHPKGRGNGYLIEKPPRIPSIDEPVSPDIETTRVYISGDTAGIPEMRALRNIDLAFVAMNLPYTMGVEEAADAVLEFKPKKVYPYHYRTPEGFSDVAKFRQLVEQESPDIEVVQLDWYNAEDKE